MTYPCNATRPKEVQYSAEKSAVFEGPPERVISRRRDVSPGQLGDPFCRRATTEAGLSRTGLLAYGVWRLVAVRRALGLAVVSLTRGSVLFLHST